MLVRVGDDASSGTVVKFEGVEESFGAPAGVGVKLVAVQHSGKSPNVAVSGQPGHARGELGGEALHPNRDWCSGGGFSARGHAR